MFRRISSHAVPRHPQPRVAARGACGIGGNAAGSRIEHPREDIAAVNGALAQAEVREQMPALGVDPADIDARVARLTDSELHAGRSHGADACGRRRARHHRHRVPGAADPRSRRRNRHLQEISLSFRPAPSSRPRGRAAPCGCSRCCSRWWLAACAGAPRLAGGRRAVGTARRRRAHRTPFFPQTQHQCGPAALATLLGAAGRPVSPDELAREIYLPGRGVRLQPEIAAAIRARGFVP